MTVVINRAEPRPAMAPPARVSVNGTVISRDAITREIQNHPASKPMLAWQQAARALVIRELLLQEAARLGIETKPQSDDEGRRETEEEALLRQLAEREIVTPDPDDEVCRRYYAKTRLHPINHTLVVRRDVAERDPTLARRIFDAFVAAKADARRTAAGVLQPYFDTGQMDGSAAQAFANDPMAYGVRPNRRILETVAGYVQRQGLLARPVALEEVFAPEMLDV